MIDQDSLHMIHTCIFLTAHHLTYEVSESSIHFHSCHVKCLVTASGCLHDTEIRTPCVATDLRAAHVLGGVHKTWKMRVLCIASKTGHSASFNVESRYF